jgi:C-terminal processing protease CtpA/Prc
VTDALCYSATDIFAAGFQDHAIGRVLGIHQNTGAGGANVWTHGLLRRLIDKPQYQPLPRGADLRVAIRRTMRVGQNAGGIVESLGIQPDDVYQMQQEDVLFGNEGVLRRAVQLLEHA